MSLSYSTIDGRRHAHLTRTPLATAITGALGVCYALNRAWWFR